MNRKNQVMLIGNLGKDAELKTFDNGNNVMFFSLATDDSYKDKQGQKVQVTDWHNVVSYLPYNEKILPYFKKAKGVIIFGKIKYKKYQDKEGRERIRTNIVMDSFEFKEKVQKSDPAQQPAAAAPIAGGQQEAPDDLPF